MSLRQFISCNVGAIHRRHRGCVRRKQLDQIILAPDRALRGGAGVHMGRPSKLTPHRQREAIARREAGEVLTATPPDECIISGPSVYRVDPKRTMERARRKKSNQRLLKPCARQQAGS
jgi:hypothetical protein